MYENANSLSKNYNDFHKDYQTKLEEIVSKKFDTDSNKFDITNRIHTKKLEKINEDLEQLEELKNSLYE